jgi:hypothetical protein
VSQKSYEKRVKMPVDSISKAHTWLLDGALACGVQNCGCKQASGAYTAVAQDAKMEILAKPTVAFFGVWVEDRKGRVTCERSTLWP